MKLSRAHYRDVLQSPLGDRAKAEMWQRIASPAASRRPWGKARGLQVLGFAACAAVAASVFVYRQDAPREPVHEAAALAKDIKTDPELLDLPDGSRVTLQKGAQLRFERASAEEIRLVLLRGKAAFTLSDRAARPFLVSASSYEIAVACTQFEVELEGAEGEEKVEVQLGRGQLEIARKGSLSRVLLESGEHWSSAMGAPLPVGARSDVDAGAHRAGIPARPLLGTSRRSSSAGHLPGGSDALDVEREDIFTRANQARLDGHPAEAARLFDRFRKQFRGDGRAGLAALELGRISLDELGRAAEAAEALRDAVRLSASAAQREDALARLVQAYERMHDQPGCLTQRAEYLRLYPAGAHRVVVARRCSPE